MGKWISNLIVMTNQYRSLMCADWAPDGSFFALAGGNLSIYIGFFDKANNHYDTEEYRKSSKSCIMTMAFDPTGKYLAYSGLEQRIHLMKVNCDLEKPVKVETDENGKEVKKYIDTSYCDKEDIKGWGNSISWTPDGKSVSVVTHSNTLHKFDVDF